MKRARRILGWVAIILMPSSFLLGIFGGNWESRNLPPEVSEIGFLPESYVYAWYVFLLGALSALVWLALLAAGFLQKRKRAAASAVGPSEP